jgi:hypothetical protein
MRSLLVLAVIFICTISFGQKMASINLKDSCIGSGGIVSVTDFKKICKICPPNVKKVISFTISYSTNAPIYMDMLCKGNRYNAKAVIPAAKPGAVIMIENIIAIDLKGNQVEVPHVTLGFK